MTIFLQSRFQYAPVVDGGSITVLSPATVANVVCGFDILGFALTELALQVPPV